MEIVFHPEAFDEFKPWKRSPPDLPSLGSPSHSGR